MERSLKAMVRIQENLARIRRREALRRMSSSPPCRFPTIRGAFRHFRPRLRMRAVRHAALLASAARRPVDQRFFLRAGHATAVA